jgi:hypothetical protein
MSKIVIIGTEKQLEVMKGALYNICPFDPDTISECGEDADCCQCINDNIEWCVAEEGSGVTI